MNTQTPKVTEVALDTQILGPLFEKLNLSVNELRKLVDIMAVIEEPYVDRVALLGAVVASATRIINSCNVHLDIISPKETNADVS